VYEEASAGFIPIIHQRDPDLINAGWMRTIS
jgi:hypothetical protein